MPLSYTKASAKETSKIDPRIVRSPHDRENPYVMINKNLINDNSLTDECRFFLIYLLSKPSDWDIRTSILAKECSSWLNRKKILKLYKESIKARYIKRVDIFEKGRRIDCIYYIAETPIYRDDSNNIARESQNRTCENGTDVLSNDYSLNTIEKEVVKKKPDRPKVVPKVSPPPSATTSAQMKQEKKSLRRDFTEEEIIQRKLKFPHKLVDEKVENVRKTMKKYPKAYASKGPDRALDEMLEEAMRKKAHTFSKKEAKMEDPNDKSRAEVQAKVGQQASSMIKFLKDFLSKNPDMINEIKIKEYNNQVDLRNLINKKRFDTYDYTDPTFKCRFDKWLSEYVEQGP